MKRFLKRTLFFSALCMIVLLIVNSVVVKGEYTIGSLVQFLLKAAIGSLIAGLLFAMLLQKLTMRIAEEELDKVKF